MLTTLAWLTAIAFSAAAAPAPVGRLVDLGGRTLHLNCTGRGQPTVVVETGLGDFSFDWVLVQRGLASATRVCTYDRAGYAWSQPGPLPCSFAQLNLELREALTRAGERGPYVLVGHSFGGGVVRQFALSFPSDVAGLLFVDIVAEQQYIGLGPHAGRIGDDAKGRSIPATVLAGPARAVSAAAAPSPVAIEPPYDRLPRREQQLHAWAAAQPSVEDAENSQREWSAEYVAKWLAAPQTGSLGALPLIVLTRARGDYGNDLDKPAAELEHIRLEAQRALADLSSAGSQRIVASGHNMHLEAPREVIAAVLDLVRAARAPRRDQPGPRKPS